MVVAIAVEVVLLERSHWQPIDSLIPEHWQPNRMEASSEDEEGIFAMHIDVDPAFLYY